MGEPFCHCKWLSVLREIHHNPRPGTRPSQEQAYELCACRQEWIQRKFWRRPNDVSGPNSLKESILSMQRNIPTSC